MAKKGHKVLSPMGTFGGSTMHNTSGKPDNVKTKTTPDPLGLVNAVGGKR